MIAHIGDNMRKPLNRSISLILPILFLMSCREDPVQPDPSTLIVGHDAGLWILGLEWVGENTIVFGARVVPTGERNAYIVDRDGLLEEFAPADHARVCYHSRVSAGLAFRDPVESYIVEEGQDGRPVFTPVADQRDVCFLGGGADQIDGPLITYILISAENPFALLQRANADRQSQSLFISDENGNEVRVPFSDHTEHFRWGPAGSRFYITDVNGGDWQFISRVLNSGERQYYFDNNLPIEVALVRSFDDIEVIPLLVPEGNLRVIDFFYTPAGIGAAIDNTIARGFGEDTAGIFIFRDGVPVNVYSGSVGQVDTNPSNECEVVFSVPRPSRGIISGLSSYELKILNVCDAVLEQGQ